MMAMASFTIGFAIKAAEMLHLLLVLRSNRPEGHE
jgi:hypothetical protein